MSLSLRYYIPAMKELNDKWVGEETTSTTIEDELKYGSISVLKGEMCRMNPWPNKRQ